MSEMVKSGTAVFKLNAFVEGGGVDASLLHDVLGSEGFDATVDFPMSIYYRELLSKVNSSALVILSTRDSAETWATSFATTIGSRDRFPGPRNAARAPFKFSKRMRALHRMTDTIYAAVGIEYDQHGDPSFDSAVEAYERWNAQVIRDVPPRQLLVHNAKDGWPPLCAFLNIDHAACAKLGPYPRTNPSHELLAGFKLLNLVADLYPVYMAALGAAFLKFLRWKYAPKSKPKAA